MADLKNTSIWSRDVILILSASFFFMSCVMLVNPLIAGFCGELGGGGFIMGAAGGLMAIISMLCRPFVGNLADELGKKRLSSAGALLMGAACIGYIAAPNNIVVIIARVVHGIGYACCSVCMSTWMSNLLPTNKIGYGMGMYGTVNAFAMSVSPAAGIAVYNIFGYRAAFGVAVIAMVIMFFIASQVKDKGEPPAELKNKLVRERQLIDVHVVPIALIIMLFTIPYCAAQAFLVKYVYIVCPAVTVSLFFPTYALFLFISRFSMKSLFDKLPFGLFVGACTASLACSLLCLHFMNNNFILCAAGFFMALSYGLMCSVCQSTALLTAGKGHRGLANSTYYLGLDIGMAGGPILGGLIFANADISSFFLYMTAVVPLILLIYAVHMRKSRPQKR